MLIPIMTIKSDDTKVNAFISDSNLISKIALYVLGAIILLLVVPKKYFDVSSIVELEKKITDISYNKIPQAPTGKSNIVIGLNDFPNTIDYLFSIALTKTQRELAISDLIIAGDIYDANNYHMIISSSDNPVYGSASNCVSSVPGSISVIDVQCFERRNESKRLCNDSFDFSKGEIIPSSIQGFSFREDHGRWTNAKTARFTCLAGSDRYKSVELEMSPFIFGSLESQRLQISVNGAQVFQESISIARDSNNPIILDLANIPVSDEYIIEFTMPDAASPKEVGLHDDRREIAFSLHRIIFH